jgi:hypothetical protein
MAFIIGTDAFGFWIVFATPMDLGEVCFDTTGFAEVCPVLSSLAARSSAEDNITESLESSRLMFETVPSVGVIVEPSSTSEPLCMGEVVVVNIAAHFGRADCAAAAFTVGGCPAETRIARNSEEVWTEPVELGAALAFPFFVAVLERASLCNRAARNSAEVNTPQLPSSSMLPVSHEDRSDTVPSHASDGTAVD